MTLTIGKTYTLVDYQNWSDKRTVALLALHEEGDEKFRWEYALVVRYSENNEYTTIPYWVDSNRLKELEAEEE